MNSKENVIKTSIKEKKMITLNYYVFNVYYEKLELYAFVRLKTGNVFSY